MKETGLAAFFHKFLGTTEHPDDADISADEIRQTLVLLEHAPGAGHQHLAHAAHFIFRYQLLDIVADVLSTPRHPNFTPVPRTFSPNFKEVTWLSKVVCTVHLKHRF